MEATFSEKMAVVLAQPADIFALAGLLILILAFAYVKKFKMTTRMLANVAIMIALTVVLHMLRLYHMPQGGSVTLGGMVPLLLLSFRYGPAAGYLAGFIYGMINLLQDPFILHPVQVLFDYPLPYMAVGLAGYFKNRIFLGTLAGISGRFVCHFVSGAVFFGSYAPAGVSPYWYSLVFNAAYIVPELIICLVLLRILPVKRLLLQMEREK